MEGFFEVLYELKHFIFLDDRGVLSLSRKLTDEADFIGFIQRHPMCAVYFTGPDCNLCKALKPKLFELLGRRFNEMAVAEVDCEASPALAAQQAIFTIPTLTIYIEGKESQRKARAFSLEELAREIERPYGMLFH